MVLKRIKLILLLLLLGSGLVFSQTITDITPAEEYSGREEPRERTTVVEHKVEVTVGSDMWDGKKEVARNVIPLRVTLDNANEDPIAVRYNDFKLMNVEGKKYSVLPLYEIDVNLEELRLEKDVEIIPEPSYELDNYFIYPIYNPVYDGYEITEYSYVMDPVIQEKYFLWDAMNADLPTQEMRQKALPEGVLDKDGIISGFLFFEDINPTDTKVIFTYDIINAQTGKKMETVEIPFFIE